MGMNTAVSTNVIPITAPCDLFHGLSCGFLGRQALGCHNAFHVLHHHDGVIHDDTDGEHHAEHGQHIDREARDIHHHEGASEGDRGDDGGDQCIADLLQEEQHHKEHEHHCLKQGVQHLLDGHRHEGRCVVGNHVFHALRHRGGEVVHALSNQFSRTHGVGAGGKLNGGCGRVVAVDAGGEGVGLCPFLDAGDVTQQQARTIPLRAQHDAGELLNGAKLAFNPQGYGIALAGDSGLSPDAPRRDLNILGRNGGIHVRQGEEIGQKACGDPPRRAWPCATRRTARARRRTPC